MLNLNQIWGIICILAGLALGAYVGAWLCFIGGLFDIFNAIAGVTTSIADIVYGIVKIVFASFLGSLSAYVLIVPGMYMIINE